MKSSRCADTAILLLRTIQCRRVADRFARSGAASQEGHINARAARRIRERSRRSALHLCAAPALAASACVLRNCLPSRFSRSGWSVDMYALLPFYYALPGPALVRWVTAKGSSDSGG
jgi:hypothetical protein